MWSHLERGSSPVDWCESNYSISPVIAEFVNTFSNVLFFLFPPVLMHLFQEYSKFCNPAINILWVLLMVVGISSAYFHATLSLVVISTGFLVMHPAANAFALMTLIVPSIGFLFKELHTFLALFCWVIDRLFCDAWLSIDFPYMHGVWHILIFIASYTALVLWAYINAVEERPEQKPQLRYWPRNDFELGVPYVSIKKPYNKQDLNI
ncbi:Alkaline ceramidase [Operophtera brumata]|uniref:Alkaline ceramidase n=1 Tax=Operophtera brumata TaxID=104452 RepID=A0A0L7LS99_OPEBR|nr:Alkaline ceramidase [Operophtera brumata]